MRRTAVGLLLALFAASSFAAVKTEEVQYQAEGVTMKGFIAYDDAVKTKRPGVLVVHEWWGHNEHARNSARKLAELGYTALAVDMYGDGKTADHPKTAGEFAGAVAGNFPLMKARFNAAYDLLAKNDSVDTKRIAAIGYCFGGGVVLQMARDGAPLAAVASFHGSLNANTPAQAGKTKARVLVLTGAEDPMIKPESVEAFKKEMITAKIDHKVVVYPGAKHSFTNPAADEAGKKFSMPVAYNAKADKASWEEMKGFFAQTFK